jgi:multiple sugar transport system permease protein
MLKHWRAIGPRARREAIEGWLSVLPWVIGFLLFTIFPFVYSFYLGFTEWTITRPPRWIGLENYSRMFTRDPLFWQAVKVTISFVALSLPLKLVFGLGLALLLNLKVKGMNFYRTLFYIPAVISGVAVSLMWMLLLHPDTGIANALLAKIGIEGPKWFWDPQWALPSIALMSVWAVGGSAIIWLAGLQNINPQLYEAAEVDGAPRWQRFLRITLPLLTPTLFFELVVQMIESFKIFTEAYVITNGGPLKATYVYLLYFYQEAFQNQNMGYASALAMVLTVMILVLTIFVNYTSKRWVYYEGG